MDRNPELTLELNSLRRENESLHKRLDKIQKRMEEYIKENKELKEKLGLRTRRIGKYND